MGVRQPLLLLVTVISLAPVLAQGVSQSKLLPDRPWEPHPSIARARNQPHHQHHQHRHFHRDPQERNHHRPWPRQEGLQQHTLGEVETAVTGGGRGLEMVATVQDPGGALAAWPAGVLARVIQDALSTLAASDAAEVSVSVSVSFTDPTPEATPTGTPQRPGVTDPEWLGVPQPSLSPLAAVSRGVYPLLPTSCDSCEPDLLTPRDHRFRMAGTVRDSRDFHDPSAALDTVGEGRGAQARVAGPPSTSTLHVCGTLGEDSPQCGLSLDAPCRTLRHAVASWAPDNAAASGPLVVHLAPGPYDALSCGVVTEVALVVVGNGSDSTVVDCGGEDRLVASTGPALTIVGLTVVNATHVVAGAPGDHGGGAVLVVWANDTLVGNALLLQDVVFTACALDVDQHPHTDDYYNGVGSVGGGAVAVVSTAAEVVQGVSITLQSVTFTGSHVGGSSYEGDMGGGGLFVSLAATTLLDSIAVTLSDVVFQAGEAPTGGSLGSGGGAFILVTGGASGANVTNVTFAFAGVTASGCAAVANGGALYSAVYNRNGPVAGVRFSFTNTTVVDSTAGTPGSAGIGGGIYAAVTTGVTAVSDVHASLNNVTAVNNAAGVGGGIYFAAICGSLRNVSVRLVGVTASGNSLTEPSTGSLGGGGLFVGLSTFASHGNVSGVDVSLEGVLLSGNTVVGDYTGRGTGGGAWVFVDAKGWVDSTSVSFDRVTAVNNFAGCCGGGLSSYINSQKDMQTTAISASFVQLINNTAGGGDGAGGASFAIYGDGTRGVGLQLTDIVAVNNTVARCSSVFLCSPIGGGVRALVSSTTNVDATLSIARVVAQGNALLAGVGGGMSIQVLGSDLVTGASVSLSNITSSSNNVTSSPSDGGGAGVHVLVSSTRNIANTSVAVQDARCDSNSQVDGHGTGLYIAMITDNYYNITNSTISVDGVTSSENVGPGGLYALLDGGGYVTASSIQISNTACDGNSGSGAGVFASIMAARVATANSVRVLNVSASGNVGSGASGGVFASMTGYSSSSFIEVAEVVASNNYGDGNYGGSGVHASFDYFPVSDVHVLLRNVVVLNNTVGDDSDDGGGLFACINSENNAPLSNTSLYLSNVTAQGNTGSGGGGGIALCIMSTDSDLTNATVTVENVAVSDNAAMARFSVNGGGLAVEVSADGDVSSAVVSLQNATFTGNTAGRGSTGGGASLLISSGGDLTSSAVLVDNVTAVGNVLAQSNGGGVSIVMTADSGMDNATMTVTNVVAVNNSAPGRGGGLSLILSSRAAAASNLSFVLQGARLEGNVAGQGSGGGAFIEVGSSSSYDVTYAQATLSDLYMMDNQALSSGQGGGLLVLVGGNGDVVSSGIVISRATAVNNSASGGGGGMFACVSADNGVLVDSGLRVSNAVITSNVAVGSDGGGLYLCVTGVASSNTTLSLGDVIAVANTATDSGSGGGVYAALTYSDSGVNNTVSITDATVAQNAAGFGAGLFVATSADPQEMTNCTSPPGYFPYTYHTRVDISGATVTNNSAQCPTCSGGGVVVGPGGDVTLTSVTLVDNAAGQHGGGLLLGSLGLLPSTCRVWLAGGVVTNNVAKSDGAQVYSTCSGDFNVRNTSVLMTVGECVASQVLVMGAGNITFADDSLLLCPDGSSFEDSFNGSYGARGATPVPSHLCNTSDQGPGHILQSRLQFSCFTCRSGQYTVVGGNSTGAPLEASGGCQACPLGGACPGGSITTTAGYWGAGSPSVSFALCPVGYCCNSPTCTGLAGCVGARTGQLCGGCQEGYTQAVGSEHCVPTSRCVEHRALVWSGVVLGLLVAAAFQLTLVSNVWVARSRTFPSGKTKLAVYFFQMSSFVRVGQVPSGSRALDLVASVLSVQLPSTVVDGVCVAPHLTAVSKVGLEVALSACVGLAMVVEVAVVVLWQWLVSPAGLAWPVFRRLPCAWCRRGAPEHASPASGSSGAGDEDGSVGLEARALLLRPIADQAGCTPSRSGYGSSDPASPLLPSDRYDRGTAAGVVADSVIPLHLLGPGPVTVAGEGETTAERGKGLAVGVEGAGAGSCADPSSSSVSHGLEEDTHAVPLRARLVCAGVNFGVSLYTTLTLAMMKLLHCVPLPGTAPGTSWLFLDGTRACAYGGWQGGLVVVLVVLCAAPLALPRLSQWASPRPSASAHSTATSMSPLLRDLRWGVHRALCAPYSTTLHYWEGVLMVQRAVLAALSVFLASSRPGVGVQASTLLSMGFLLLQVVVGPLRDPAAQRLQGVLLFSLAVLALASAPAAERQESASVATGFGAPSESLARGLRVVFGSVVPLVAVVASFCPPPGALWAKVVGMAERRRSTPVARV